MCRSSGWLPVPVWFSPTVAASRRKPPCWESPVPTRPNTERPITCEIGTNVLVGTDPHRILHEANSILDGNSRPGAIPEKWDGHAAERIVDVLLNQAVQDSCPVYV